MSHGIGLEEGHAEPPCRRHVALVIWQKIGVDERPLLERTLTHIRGVSRVSVIPATGAAYIEYCPLRCQVEDVLGAIRAQGFEVHEQDLHYHG